MGRDKATLVYQGRTLIDHMQDIVGQTGADPVTVAAPRYDVQDVVPGAGPMAGICGLAELVITKGWPDQWLIVPVDMPLLTPTALSALAAKDAPASYFVSNPLPLMLKFNPQTLPFVEAARRDLKAGRSVSVQRFLSALGACSVMADGEIAAQIVNVNSPEEWRAIQPQKADV